MNQELLKICIDTYYAKDTPDSKWDWESGMTRVLYVILNLVLNDRPSHKEFDAIHNSKWCLFGEGERCRAASEAMRMLLKSRREYILGPSSPKPLKERIEKILASRYSENDPLLPKVTAQIMAEIESEPQ